MEVLNRFFQTVAWVSTGFFIVKMLVTTFHGGADSHGDFDHDLAGDGHADLSFKLISFQSILAFGMGFGWIGQAALVEWGLSPLAAMISASFFGFAVLMLSAVVMGMMKKLNHEYTPKIEGCIGRTGKVYLPIPEKGTGQVEVPFGGGIKILDAISESGAISTSQSIQVSGVRDGVLVVKTI